MITYKASDLVTAAMKLADLENTGFISASENRMYINMAWESIYQDAINNGETFWNKTTTIKEGENDLPTDFYQLIDVTDNLENKVLRKTKNDTKSDKWYNVYQNKIILNKCAEATVEYIPEPNTLDIEGEGDIELSYPKNILYNIMVMKLAEYYKVRQGGDIGGIELMLENALNQYYNMLNRDANQNLVIEDIYTGNRFFV